MLSSPKKRKRSSKDWKTSEEIPIPYRTLKRWQNVDKSSINAGEGSSTTVNIDINEQIILTDDEDVQSENDSSIHSNSSETDSLSSESGSDYSSDCEKSEDEEQIERNVLKLHKFSDATLHESVVKLMDLYITSKMKKSTLERILLYQQTVLPQPNLMPTSIFKLFDYVKKSVPSCAVIKHYYCSKCVSYVGIDTNFPNECPKCQPSDDNSPPTWSYFFEFDLCDQFKHLFENGELAEKMIRPTAMAHNENYISDITDGSEYKRVNMNRIGHYDLTLMLNTDGLSLSKSSTTHCWPLLAMIVELPEYLRESYMIVLGFWCDRDNKPNMDTFMKPFCEKLKYCYNTGITWKNKLTDEMETSKIVAPMFVADAPARASLQNILNFNGRFGCNICEVRTQLCSAIQGKKNVSRYLVRDNNVSPLRTNENMRKQAKDVQQNLKLKHIMGVKGPSPVAEIPLIDVSTFVFPEYLHSVLLGVVKQVLRIWVDKVINKSSLNTIAKFLKNVKPPNTITRPPRNLIKYKLFKGSELLNWILYFSIPTLLQVLPDDRNLQHWMLLVISIFNLSKRNVSINSDLTTADRFLLKFVQQFESLYGDRECTYNVHQLIHLPLMVRRWGPLWANSAFPFESYNGVIGNCIHGTKNFGMEINNFLNLARGVRALKMKINLENSETASSSGCSNKLKFELKNATTKYKHRLHTDELEKIIAFIPPEKVVVYLRAKINSTLFTSELYKDTKSNNYTVQLQIESQGTSVYGTVRFFLTSADDETEFYIIVKQLQVDPMKILFHREEQTKVEHILPLKTNQNSNYIFIKSSNIRSIKHLIRVGDYICKQPNYLKKVL